MKLASVAIMIRLRYLPDSIIARKVSASEFSHSLSQEPTYWTDSRVGPVLRLKRTSPRATPVNESMTWTGPRPDCFMGPGGAAVPTDSLNGQP